MKPHVTESARDAFQSIHSIIPTDVKVEYINLLLQAGFDTVDIGSFVSPKAIPQMQDTGEVLQRLHLTADSPRIMVLFASEKGLQKTLDYDEISIICFPYSPSPTFLKRNINSDRDGALQLIEKAQKGAVATGKELLVYVSMSFGNPYNDPYHPDMLFEAARELRELGVSSISLSDINGFATAESIYSLCSTLLPEFPDMEIGMHLHTPPGNAWEKVDASYRGGCRYFDSVVRGLGGCPMTGYELLSNLNTRTLHDYFNRNNIPTTLNEPLLTQAETFSMQRF